MNTLLAAPVSLGTETVASFPAPDLHTTGTLPSIPRAEILPQTSAHPSGRYEWDGQQAIAEGYAHFIHQQWYSDLNQHLVKFAPVATAGELVDLGCGPGTNFGLLAPAAKIYAIDISHEMITLAKAASASHSKPAQEIICLVGSGQDLSAMLPNSVNQVYIFNALHLHADPLETLKQAYDSLLPGGQLAFNVGFTRDSVTREYLPEMLRMIRAIREAAVERLPELEFGHEKRLMAGFTCAQYADMARVAGFVVL